jgi:hypothetical protein
VRDKHKSSLRVSYVRVMSRLLRGNCSLVLCACTHRRRLLSPQSPGVRDSSWRYTFATPWGQRRRIDQHAPSRLHGPLNISSAAVVHHPGLRSVSSLVACVSLAHPPMLRPAWPARCGYIHRARSPRYCIRHLGMVLAVNAAGGMTGKGSEVVRFEAKMDAETSSTVCQVYI